MFFNIRRTAFQSLSHLTQYLKPQISVTKNPLLYIYSQRSAALFLRKQIANFGSVTVDDNLQTKVDGINISSEELSERLRHLEEDDPLNIQIDSHHIEFQRKDGELQIIINGKWTEVLRRDMKGVSIRFSKKNWFFGSTVMRWPSKRDQSTRSEPSQGVQAEWKIMSLAKRQNFKEAMLAFQNAVKENVKLSEESLNTLMYLCAGGTLWETHIRELNTFDKVSQSFPEPNVERQQAFECGEVLMDYFEKQQIQPNEAYFTSMARLVAQRRDIEAAVKLGVLASNLASSARARTFAPSMLACASQKNYVKAIEIVDSINSMGLALTENEYSLLLESFEDSAPYELFSKFLLKMQEIDKDLSDETINRIKSYFLKNHENKNMPSPNPWIISRTRVDNNSNCVICRGKLMKFEPTVLEFEKLENAVVDIFDSQRSRNAELHQLRAFLNTNGPYDVIIDGSNVAFYSAKEKISVQRFLNVLEAVEKTFPNKKPLIILHSSRLSSITPEENYVISNLITEKKLFATPFFDGLMWLYATLSRKENGYLITNDEMSDLQLPVDCVLAFKRFKELHQVRFTSNGLNLSLLPPRSHSRLIQKLENGSWAVPTLNGDWLCFSQAK